MFLITSTVTLCVSLSLLFSIMVLVDGEHRIRLDRIQGSGGSPFALLSGAVKRQWGRLSCGGKRKGAVRLEDED